MSIASEIARLQNAKANIKTAIEAKGVEIPSNATLDEYSDYVEEIPSGGTDTRWQEIGYDQEPDAIQDGIDYAKQIMQNWDASVTDRSYGNGFRNDYKLVFFPDVDMSNVTNTASMFSGDYCLISTGNMDLSNATNCNNMFESCFSLRKFGDILVKNYAYSNNMFNGCRALEEVGIIKIANSYNSSSMFYNCTSLKEIKNVYFVATSHSSTNLFANCPSLSNNSLKKILIALNGLTAQSSSNKTLKYFGLSQTQAELCTTFDEWTDLANAGWTTGY
jgi:hypothetical protein